MAVAERQPAISYEPTRAALEVAAPSASRDARDRARFSLRWRGAELGDRASESRRQEFHAERQPLRRLARAHSRGVSHRRVCVLAWEQTLGADWPNDGAGVRARRNRGARHEDHDRPRATLGEA